jgi:ectoine hydroxylase-related dioxygenase (phytanoyl-CoA dioxygenase family)
LLREFGVSDSSLTVKEKIELDRDGYTVLPGVVDDVLLTRLRDCFELLSARDQGGSATASKETGTRHVDNLINRERLFDVAFAHPRVLAAAYHVLKRPFRLAQVGGRDPLPGYGQQGLHADWEARRRGEPFRITTTIMMLDDFSPTNGPTRVVPGTHLLLNTPPKQFADPARRHPEQWLVTAPAGSVLAFNGHLWHSGTRNESNGPRRALQTSFVERGELRFYSGEFAGPEPLSPAARYMMGLERCQA